MPFTDNDDSYGGRIYMGVYSNSSQNARENGNKERQNAPSPSPSRTSKDSKDRVSTNNGKKDSLAPFVNSVGERSRRNSPNIVKIELEEDSYIMAPTTSDSDSVEAMDSEVENQKEKSGDNLVRSPLAKRSKKDIDEDSLKMPPPPLPARFRKKINLKVDVDAEPPPPPTPPAPPLGQDWHEHLKTLYGSVEVGVRVHFI